VPSAPLDGVACAVDDEAFLHFAGVAMDNDVAARINELKDYMEMRHNELKDYMEKHYATKVDLLTFREEVAVQFGQVHVEIAQLHVNIAKLETTVIKWFVATAITIGGMSFAIARYVN
jgi:hypothetical protein